MSPTIPRQSQLIDMAGPQWRSQAPAAAVETEEDCAPSEGVSKNNRSSHASHVILFEIVILGERDTSTEHKSLHRRSEE